MSPPLSDSGSVITKYQVYRSTTNGTGYVLIGDTSNTTILFTDSTGNPEETCYYVIKAKNGKSLSDASNEVVILVPETSKNNSNNRIPTNTPGFELLILITCGIILICKRVSRK